MVKAKVPKTISIEELHIQLENSFATVSQFCYVGSITMDMFDVWQSKV